MKRRAGWLLLGLGVHILDLGAALLDLGASWAAVIPPPGMTGRIMDWLLAEEEKRSSWLTRPENWRDNV